MEVVIFDAGSDFLRRVFRQYPSGGLRVICPACGEEMVVVINDEDAIRLNRPWGIYCLNGHVSSKFNYR